MRNIFFGLVSGSVSDPYSLNPDLDPAKTLNPDSDPENPWNLIQAISEQYLKIS